MSDLIDDSATEGDSIDDEESRAAMRAFLQRSEVRLSTIHRVAQGLLGGSALVLLLPLFLRDAFPKMMTVLIALYDAGQDRLAVVALAIAATLVVTLPVPAIFLLVGDLLAFYFTSNTFGSHGPDMADDRRRLRFSPRFIVPGLGMNDDELSEATRAKLDVEREDRWTRGLLVPPGPEDHGWRERFDARADDVWGIEITPGPDGDTERIRHSYRLAGLHADRTLAHDVARTEALLTRHVLGIRTALLRYSKALLLMISTTVVTLAASGLVDQAVREDPTGGRFVDGFPYRIVFLVSLAYVAWAPLAARSVTAPLRMIHRHTPGVGEHRDVYLDRQSTQFESATIVITAVVLLAAVTAMLDAGWRSAGTAGVVVGAALALAGIVTWFWTLREFRTRPSDALRSLRILIGGPTTPTHRRRRSTRRTGR